MENLNQVFVSMPFGSTDSARVFDAISAAAKLNRLEAYRVDHELEAKPIPESIEKGIRNSNIFIADLTGNKPNVYHEIGQAQAIGKPIILITRDRRTELHKNLESYQTHRYSVKDLGKLKALLRNAFAKASSKNELLRMMLHPGSLGKISESRKFVIVASPLSYRRAMGRSGGYSQLRKTTSDHVGIRAIYQSFGLLYGMDMLPEMLDPEDYEDEVIKHRMNIYSIGSPKANRWTGILLNRLAEIWSPAIDFRANEKSNDLRNISISLFKGNRPFHPDDWDLDIDGDRHRRDFGVIVRGPNPYPNNTQELITIVAGRSSLGTEAACRAFTSPEKIEEIAELLSGRRTSLEDHKQPFWALVSMEKPTKGKNRDPLPESLSVDDAGILKAKVQ